MKWSRVCSKKKISIPKSAKLSCNFSSSNVYLSFFGKTLSRASLECVQEIVEKITSRRRMIDRSGIILSIGKRHKQQRDINAQSVLCLKLVDQGTRVWGRIECLVFVCVYVDVMMSRPYIYCL